MASMNLIFHIAAALAFVALGYWLARLRADLELLRRLATAKRAPRVWVMAPSSFVRGFARALAIPCEGSAAPAAQAPTRIDVAVWSDLLSTTVPRLIRWTDSALTIVVQSSDPQSEGDVSRGLSAALGGIPVKVEISAGGTQHAQS
jgi:hypothetical protein